MDLIAERNVVLVDITRDNWKEFIALCVAPEDEEYVGTAAEIFISATFSSHEVQIIVDADTKQKVGVLEFSCPQTDTIRIHNFFIDCSWQCRGYGTAVIKQILQFRDSEHLAVDLSVHKDNTSAIEFYRKHGFVLKEHHPSPDHYEMTWLPALIPAD